MKLQEFINLSNYKHNILLINLINDYFSIYYLFIL